MKRQRKTVSILIASFVCLLFGLSCIIVGIFTECWMVDKRNEGNRTELGILRYCKSTTNGEKKCDYLKNVFKFSNHDMEGGSFSDHRDVVLLCMCLSAAVALIAFIPFTISSCMSVKTWECSTLLNTGFVSSAAVISISGMIYAEFKFKSQWDAFMSDRTDSWSYMLSWIGASLLLISSILSFISVFLDPRHHYKIKKSPNSGIRGNRRSNSMRSAVMRTNSLRTPQMQVHSIRSNREVVLQSTSPMLAKTHLPPGKQQPSVLSPSETKRWLTLNNPVNSRKQESEMSNLNKKWHSNDLSSPTLLNPSKLVSETKQTSILDKTYSSTSTENDTVEINRVENPNLSIESSISMTSNDSSITAKTDSNDHTEFAKSNPVFENENSSSPVPISPSNNKIVYTCPESFI